MSSTDFALAIEDLTVSFDGFKAIDALTLYIDRNELRVIIGPNGAGKTTLLDLICGKTKASAGSIKFKNEEIPGAGAQARARASAENSRRRRSTRTSALQNLVSYPSVARLGRLASATDEIRQGEDRGQDIGPRQAETEAGCSRTGRSNG
jgi:urea transport system ATP-binding protein